MFYLFIALVVFQRIMELLVARKNENWMKAQGAIEFGTGHYRMMVFMHTSFFIVYIIEVIFLNKSLSTFWPVLLALFLLTQAGRLWTLLSLGKYWNTKIIVLPNANPVMRGPYRFLKHPNYVIVTIELIIIPLMYNAYLTAIQFTFLNVWILSVRIPEEERALQHLTEYEQTFKERNRFIPRMLKNCDN